MLGSQSQKDLIPSKIALKRIGTNSGIKFTIFSKKIGIRYWQHLRVGEKVLIPS